jgi:two-component system response regulator FimZ (fimbrial Z protein)/two-component system response regulator EvgA
VGQLNGCKSRFVSVKDRDAFYAKVVECKPAVVFIENSFLRTATAYYIGKLKSEYPQIRFAVFSYADMDIEDISDFVTLRGASFIDCRRDDDEVLLGFQTVIDGDDYIPDDISDKINNMQLSPIIKFDLSKREFQIIKLLFKGMSTTVIAGEFHISHYTVTNHRSHIFKKCGISRTVQLPFFIFDLGVVENWAGFKT